MHACSGILKLFICYNMLTLVSRLVVLIAFLAVLSILSCTWVPWFLKLMMSLSSQVRIYLIMKFFFLSYSAVGLLKKIVYMCFSYIALFIKTVMHFCRQMNSIN
jgi:hypothetical protein